MNTLALVMAILAAIPITPDVVVSAVSILVNLWQFIKGRNVKRALETVADGVEHAARLETNPKRAIALQTWAPAAKAVLDTVLKKKGYKR